MSNEINDGGPAFPAQPIYRSPHGMEIAQEQSGMTLRQYAAIKLKVPNSGTDWLDEMIRESLRNELEARAMAAIIAHPGGPAGRWEQCALDAHEVADAVLKAREGK